MSNDGVENRACRWTRVGGEDLRWASHCLHEANYTMCAFHCQQAAEKYLKALLVFRTDAPPLRTHDLQRLGSQVDLPAQLLRGAADLSHDYAPTRYPDAEPTSAIPYDRPGCEQRLEMAEAIVNWVRQRIGEEE